MAHPAPRDSCSLLTSFAQHSQSDALIEHTFAVHIGPAIYETLSNECVFFFLFVCHEYLYGVHK